ncbi:MAG: sugar phosphate isomerase/epimerase family protein [Fimbriimonas sp.]
MKPISIQLYTVREEVKDGRHLDVLKRIADIGYKGVEGGADFGYTNTEFRAVIEDLGMVVSSTWGPMPDSDENVEKLIQSAEELGTTNLVGGLWVQDFESQDAIKRTAERLNYGLPALARAGLTYALHNHWIEFEPMNGALRIDHLIELCPDLQLEIDVYWCTNFGANDPAEQVRRFRDRAPLLHVKDGSQVRDEPMVAVGSGSLDIPGVLAAANPDVVRWHIVELDHCATDMLDAVEGSYQYLVGNGLALGNKPV